MLREKIEDVLNNRVRPSLQADGGDIKLIDVNDDGIIKVKLTGTCSGCSMSTMTLKMGVEKILKQNIPEIIKIESV